MTDARDPGRPPAASNSAAGKQSTRRNPRVHGPFDARRLGALELPLRIHDLSLGGCLVESYDEVPVGRRIQLEIELPEEGWVTVQVEALYQRENYGFGAKFVDVDEQTRVKLARVVLQILKERKKAR
jgi:hypothetical protein